MIDRLWRYVATFPPQRYRWQFLVHRDASRSCPASCTRAAAFLACRIRRTEAALARSHWRSALSRPPSTVAGLGARSVPAAR